MKAIQEKLAGPEFHAWYESSTGEPVEELGLFAFCGQYGP